MFQVLLLFWAYGKRETARMMEQREWKKKNKTKKTSREWFVCWMILSVFTKTAPKQQTSKWMERRIEWDQFNVACAFLRATMSKHTHAFQIYICVKSIEVFVYFIEYRVEIDCIASIITSGKSDTTDEQQRPSTQRQRKRVQGTEIGRNACTYFSFISLCSSQMLSIDECAFNSLDSNSTT